MTAKGTPRSKVDLNAALRRLRESRQLTQTELGQRMRPKRLGPGVQKIESGNARARNVEEYLSALDANLWDLARAHDEAMGVAAQTAAAANPDLLVASLIRELEHWMSKTAAGRARLADLKKGRS